MFSQNQAPSNANPGVKVPEDILNDPYWANILAEIHRDEAAEAPPSAAGQTPAADPTVTSPGNSGTPSKTRELVGWSL